MTSHFVLVDNKVIVSPKAGETDDIALRARLFNVIVSPKAGETI